MVPQDLEDLLHRKQFLFSDSVDIQILVDRAIVDMQAQGRPLVITRIFANTPRWLGQRVIVPREGSGIKVVSVQYDDKMEGMKLDFVFYYPDEVKVF